MQKAGPRFFLLFLRFACILFQASFSGRKTMAKSKARTICASRRSASEKPDYYFIPPCPFHRLSTARGCLESRWSP